MIGPGVEEGKGRASGVPLGHLEPLPDETKRNETMSGFSRSPVRQVKGHRDKVTSLAWACDGRRLASGSADGSIRIWTPDRPERGSSELRGHTGSSVLTCWNPTHPDELASCSSDKTFRPLLSLSPSRLDPVEELARLDRVLS